jgi:Acetyltransferases
MTVTISIEPAVQDDVRTFVAALNDFLLPLSPEEFQFGLTVEQMADADTTVFVARDAAGHALGMGALKAHSDGLGEVKRMYVAPQARGKRIGNAILDAISAEAQAKGLTALVLETGNTDAMADAFRLYERYGFTRRGAFHDYPDSGHSRFYEKKLDR